MIKRRVVLSSELQSQQKHIPRESTKIGGMYTGSCLRSQLNGFGSALAARHAHHDNNLLLHQRRRSMTTTRREKATG
jgi:hypothetical protein